MINKRTLLALSLILAVGVNLGLGLPGKRAAEDAAQSGATAGEKDDYNPQCLPLDYFEKEQSGEARAKRDDAAAGAEGAAAAANEEIVAQPGFFAPARRRRPCLGRGINFTKDCGPLPRAYRVRNFVMAKNPQAEPNQQQAGGRRPFRNRPFRN